MDGILTLESVPTAASLPYWLVVKEFFVEVMFPAVTASLVVSAMSVPLSFTAVAVLLFKESFAP